MELGFLFEINELLFVDVFGSFHVFDVFEALIEVFVEGLYFFLKDDFVEEDVLVVLGELFELLFEFFYVYFVLGVFVFEELNLCDVGHVLLVEVFLLTEQLIQLRYLVTNRCEELLVLLQLLFVLLFKLRIRLLW